MYRLNVHKIDQSCLFDLTWGRGQRLTASVAFPDSLLALYDSWRRAYLGYYKQSLRGRVGAAGQVQGVAVDWHSQLVQGEARLLLEFHHWLKQGELFDLRQELVGAAKTQGSQSPGGKLELFLTCAPLEVARLPWETWEFGPHIDIVRAPATLRSTPAATAGAKGRRSRVLAILGDETGLNFVAEQEALNAQRRLLDIHYVGWQPGEEAAGLKQRICAAIADPQGWDVLFFAGHSNEAALVDGQVAIAPRTTLTIKELSPYLQQAQRHGLQFALFNSCSGLNIAHGLINLGLRQVAIMREPIHNDVAQDFLVAFLQGLAQGEDVQVALRRACQWLKVEKALTYPSAHLVPSLFRHPDSVPYRIPQVGWRSQVQRWRPRPWEALALGTVLGLSFVPSLHYWLLNQRVWGQAVYREFTGQVAQTPTPPVVVVHIDQQTFQARNLTSYKPIDRALLADIFTVVTQQGAPVVGVDYLLDLEDPKGNDGLLRAAVQTAITDRQVWPVFITSRNPGGSWIVPYHQGVEPDWILQGDGWVPWWHLNPRRQTPDTPAPFSYQLALAHHLQQRAATPGVPRPNIDGTALEDEVQAYLRQAPSPPISPRSDLRPLTQFSYQLRQRWLQPLIDLSLPPREVYQTLVAWELLAAPGPALATLNRETLADAVVIIAAGGYYEAGIARDGDDNFPIPPALAHWLQGEGDTRPTWSGGEAHAYLTHHLLLNHLVIPLPDSWLILTAALLGKGLALTLAARPHLRPGRWIGYLAGATVGYGLVGLQLYISAGVMVPWLLPSVVLWLYGLPVLKEKFRASTHELV